MLAYEKVHYVAASSGTAASVHRVGRSVPQSIKPRGSDGTNEMAFASGDNFRAVAREYNCGCSTKPSGSHQWAGAAPITTGNCNSAGTTPPGLCQPDPACNGGAGPNPDNISATLTLCEVSASSPVVDSSIRSGPARSSGTLRVRGTGTGFRFGKTYISLIYQNGNTATCSRFPVGIAATPTEHGTGRQRFWFDDAGLLGSEG